MPRPSKRKQHPPPSPAGEEDDGEFKGHKPHHRWLLEQLRNLLDNLQQCHATATAEERAEIEDRVIDSLELLMSGRGTAVIWGQVATDAGVKEDVQLAESAWRKIGIDTIAEIGKNTRDWPFYEIVKQTLILAQAEQKALRKGRAFGAAMAKKVYVRLFDGEDRERGKEYVGKRAWSASSSPHRGFPVLQGEEAIFRQVLPRNGHSSVDFLLDKNVIAREEHRDLHWLRDRDPRRPLLEEERERFAVDELYRRLRGGGIIALRFEFEEEAGFAATAKRMR